MPNRVRIGHSLSGMLRGPLEACMARSEDVDSQPSRRRCSSRRLGHELRARCVIAGSAGRDRRAARHTVDPLKFPTRQLEPVEWSDLDGWASDDHARRLRGLPGQLRAVQPATSAARYARRSRLLLKDVCKRRCRGRRSRATRRARSSRRISGRCGSPSSAKRPGCSPAITSRSSTARAFRIREFHVPLYRRPRDLVVTGRSKPQGATSLPQPRPRDAAGSTTRRSSSPITTALAIEDGALDGQKLEIC